MVEPQVLQTIFAILMYRLRPHKLQVYQPQRQMV